MSQQPDISEAEVQSNEPAPVPEEQAREPIETHEEPIEEPRVKSDITSMAQALVPLEPRSLNEMKAVATIFAESGLFKDVRSMAQAFVKMMAGREMGFPAFASMKGIHIIDGQPTVGAGLMATAIKRSGQYTYHIKTLNNEICEIEFSEYGKLIGVSTFTMEDAQKLGVVRERSGWEKNPRNMLFARALSNGQRWFCADVFDGPVYTPEEMGAEVDEDGNMIIDGEFDYAPTETATGPGQPINGGSRNQPPKDRRVDTTPRTTPEDPKKNRPDPNTPWQDVIKDWAAKDWAAYWGEMHKLDLTPDEVHEALGNPVDPETGKVSVKAFAGTRGEHNTLIVNAGKKKRGEPVTEDPETPAEPATPEPPAQPKGTVTQKGKPFHMPTPPLATEEAKPEPASGKVSMVADEGYIAPSRIICTAEGRSTRLTIYAFDENLNEDPMPVVDHIVPISMIRKQFGKQIEGQEPFAAEGTVIYQRNPDDESWIELEYRRVDKQVVITEVAEI